MLGGIPQFRAAGTPWGFFHPARLRFLKPERMSVLPFSRRFTILGEAEYPVHTIFTIPCFLITYRRTRSKIGAPAVKIRSEIRESFRSYAYTSRRNEISDLLDLCDERSHHHAHNEGKHRGTYCASDLSGSAAARAESGSPVSPARYLHHTDHNASRD
jgi:hypothetical protein